MFLYTPLDMYTLTSRKVNMIQLNLPFSINIHSCTFVNHLCLICGRNTGKMDKQFATRIFKFASNLQQDCYWCQFLYLWKLARSAVFIHSSDTQIDLEFIGWIHKYLHL